MKKRIFCFLLLLVFIPCIFVPVFAVDPFTDSEVQQHTSNNSNGSVVTDCTISPSQYYRFQLWETQWNDYIGAFFNETPQFQRPSICGRVRPFGNEINLNIGSSVGDTVNSGFYMPLPKEQINTIDFMLGLNINIQANFTPVISDQEIYGNLYLYYINANGTILKKESIAFRYQWVWHSASDNLSLYCLLSVPVNKSELPSGTVGFIPVYSFRTIELNHDFSIVFFPDFSFTFKSSLYDNLWNDLVGVGQLEDGLLGFAGSGFTLLLTTLKSAGELLTLFAGRFQVLSRMIDDITSIPYISTLLFVSLACGSVGAFPGIGLAVAKSSKRD